MSSRFSGVRRHLPTIAIAMATAALVSARPAIATTVVSFATNAGMVDNKHAAASSSSVASRKGKLVATSASTGLLPNNIIAKALDSDLLDGHDSSTFMQSGDAAGGALSGTYPDPDLAAGSVGGSQVQDNSLTGDDINESLLDIVPAANPLDGYDANQLNRGEISMFSDSDLTLSPTASQDITPTKTSQVLLMASCQVLAPAGSPIRARFQIDETSNQGATGTYYFYQDVAANERATMTAMLPFSVISGGNYSFAVTATSTGGTCANGILTVLDLSFNLTGS